MKEANCEEQHRKSKEGGSGARQEAKWGEGEKEGKAEDRAEQTFACSDLYSREEKGNLREKGTMPEATARDAASRSPRRRKRRREASRSRRRGTSPRVCSSSSEKGGEHRRKQRAASGSERSASSEDDAGEDAEQSWYSDRSDEEQDKLTEKKMPSSSAAMWSAPGQATNATKKVIRLFESYFKQMKKRPCNLKEDGVGLWRKEPEKRVHDGASLPA